MADKLDKLDGIIDDIKAVGEALKTVGGTRDAYQIISNSYKINLQKTEITVAFASLMLTSLVVSFYETPQISVILCYFHFV